MKYIFCFYTFFLLIVFQSNANNYYVSPLGKDSNEGSLNKPFKTIQKAAKLMKAGDICFIREGVYHETIVINNLHGNEKRPIRFKAYNNEKVVLDGTQLLEPKWEKHTGKIYKAKLKEDIWQLFVDKKSMTSARWPNGNWYDGSVWDKTKSMAWPEKNKGSYGHHLYFLRSKKYFYLHYNLLVLICLLKHDMKCYNIL